MGLFDFDKDKDAELPDDSTEDIEHEFDDALEFEDLDDELF